MIKIILFFGLAATLLIPICFGLISAFFYSIWKMMNFESKFRKYFVKYENEEIARMVAGGKLWTGQTREQLKDARGEPDHVERAGDSEIWMYAGTVLAPRGLRIVIANDRVQTWQ